MYFFFLFKLKTVGPEWLSDFAKATLPGKRGSSVLKDTPTFESFPWNTSLTLLLLMPLQSTAAPLYTQVE